MTTLQGMLAQTIHEDRVRGYEDPSRLHRVQATRTTAQASSLRKLLGQSILRFGRPAASGSAVAHS